MSEIQVPSFVNDRNKQWREQYRINPADRKKAIHPEKNKERYTAKSGSREKAIEGAKRKGAKVIAAIAVIGVSALVAVGSYQYLEMKNAPTNYVEEIPSNIKNGMNNFLVNEIKEKEGQLNRYKAGEISLEQLTSGDMKTFVEEYAELAKTVAENKLADKEGIEGVEFAYLFNKTDGSRLFAYDLEGNKLKIPRQIEDTYRSAVELEDDYLKYANGDLTGKQMVNKVKSTFKNTGELATTIYAVKDREEER